MGTDEVAAKRVGVVLGASNTSDVVDDMAVSLAVGTRSTVVAPELDDPVWGPLTGRGPLDALRNARPFPTPPGRPAPNGRSTTSRAPATRRPAIRPTRTHRTPTTDHRPVAVALTPVP